jgi:hypothetical protein
VGRRQVEPEGFELAAVKRPCRCAAP